MSTDQEYYDARLREIPADVLQKAVEYTKQLFREHSDLEQHIRSRIAEFGLHDWIMYFHDPDPECDAMGINPRPGHFTWGMAFRNALRTEAKLPDDRLPQHNWDDYYMGVVEVALGVRPWPDSGADGG